MNKPLTIIKLGGAAITDKKRDFTARKEIISQVIGEISTVDHHCIIIHGAGSFAHNLARKYDITDGYQGSIEDNEQRRGVSLIRNSMQRLHQMILDQAERNELLTFSVPISSTLMSKGSADVEFLFIDVFQQALNHGFIPVSYGDMVFDTSSAGFRVVSGDRIIKLLCQHLTGYNIRVIFGSDVDGLYDRDPREDDAKLFDLVKYTEIEDHLAGAGESAGIDVTGGMSGKLQQIDEISQWVSRIDIVNITHPHRLSKLLRGEAVVSTSFVP